MEKKLQIVNEMYQKYRGTGYHTMIFAAALVLLLILTCVGKQDKDERKKKIITISFVVILLGITYCPFTSTIIRKYCVGTSVYWRMFWLLPVPLVIAYAWTDLLHRCRKHWCKYIGLIAAIAVIGVGGSLLYTEEFYTEATNHAKLPDEAIHVCDYIEKDVGERQLDQVRLLSCYELLIYIRQYNGDIKMPYGRDAARDKKNVLFDMLLAADTDSTELVQEAKRQGCNYMVRAYDEAWKEWLTEAGCEYLDNIDGFAVYYLGE